MVYLSFSYEKMQREALGDWIQIHLMLYTHKLYKVCADDILYTVQYIGLPKVNPLESTRMNVL